jgi:DNA polymerase III gamma/tau subunit
LVTPQVLGSSTQAIAESNTEEILKIIAELVESGQDLQTFCRGLLGQFRHLMVLKAGVSDTAVLGIPDSMVKDLKDQAALFSREDLLRLFDALMKVEGDLKRATQVRFQLEMGLVELAQIKKLRSLEDLIEDVRQWTGGSPSGGGKGGGSGGSGTSTRIPRAENRGVQPAPRTSPPKPPPKSDVTKAASGGDPRSLLLKIAAAVKKESLEPILQSLSGADRRADRVVLDLGDANEFVRRQLKENLGIIAEAASAVVGQKVQMQFGDEPLAPVNKKAAVAPTPSPTNSDLLERAKQEPVIRSFLDTFPGPVKTEKIDT